MTRDLNDFTTATREVLAKRAGQRCSRPGCPRATVGPHTEADRAVDIGEASHIRGARPGSARYDAQMTPTERSNITNAIWLCRSCAKLIDSDPSRYTVDLLHAWKLRHEADIERSVSGAASADDRLSGELLSFASEPPPARQVAVDRPDFWPILLTIQLLRPKLDAVILSLRDLERGLNMLPTEHISLREFAQTFDDWSQDCLRAAHALNTLINDDLQRAWVGGDGTGDPVAILHACNNLAAVCRAVFEHEARIAATRFPSEIAHLRDYCQGWTTDFVQQMRRVVDELAAGLAEAEDKLSRGDDSKTVKSISVALVAPQKLQDIPAQLDALPADVKAAIYVDPVSALSSLFASILAGMRSASDRPVKKTV